MEIRRIKVSELALNEGQVEGLPRNPRTWTHEELDRLARSIEETPELFEARPVLAYDWKDGERMVVLGGNMRLTAAKQLGWKDVPSIVFPRGTEQDKLAEIVIKDNGAFGSWDWDTLANEWDSLPLNEWGVAGFVDVEKEVKKLQKDEERAARVPFTEVLNEEHNYVVLYFDNDVDWLQAQTLLDIKPVRAFPTSRGGTENKIGVGRVMRGAEAIQKIIEHGHKC